MRLSHDHEIREACQRLMQQGWTYRNGAKHGLLYTPSKRFRLTIPVSAGEQHAVKNFLSQVRRLERMEAEHAVQRR